MKLGIRNLKYILATKVSDYSMLPPGSTFNFDSFRSADLQQLPFTPEAADFSEKWHYDDNGKYSDVTLTVPIRADKDSYRDTLQALTGKKFIFQVELVSGVKYIIGSPEFVPTCEFSDGISGISTSGFTLNISCQSLHGVLLAS